MVTCGSQVGKLRQEVIKKNLDPGHTNGRWQSRPAVSWINHSEPQLVTLPPAFGKLDHAVRRLEQ